MIIHERDDSNGNGDQRIMFDKTGDKCLMILEADQSQGQSLALLLQAYGYPCLVLNHIHELMQVEFQPHRVHCLLADVGTHLNACPQLDAYIQDNPQLPVIAMSCAGNVNLAVTYTRMGTVSFLQKPIELDVLLQAVKDGLKLGEQIMHYRQQRHEFEDRMQKLSPREQEVLQMVLDGLSSSQIARQLNLSIKTVSLYRTNLMSKLNADGVVQLVRMITPSPLPRPYNQWQRT